jgi:hypothetical protein
MGVPCGPAPCPHHARRASRLRLHQRKKRCTITCCAGANPAPSYSSAAAANPDVNRYLERLTKPGHNVASVVLSGTFNIWPSINLIQFQLQQTQGSFKKYHTNMKLIYFFAPLQI